MALELWRPRGGLARGPLRDIDELFNRLTREWPWGSMSNESRGWSPSVDMLDHRNEVVIRADLPGLEQKDIQVTLENNVLTIHGERQQQEEAKDNDYYCCERWSGTFFRSLTLPPGVDPTNVEAKFKNGVLEIHIPKKREAAAKKIEVKAA